MDYPDSKSSNFMEWLDTCELPFNLVIDVKTKLIGIACGCIIAIRLLMVAFEITYSFLKRKAQNTSNGEQIQMQATQNNEGEDTNKLNSHFQSDFINQKLKQMQEQQHTMQFSKIFANYNSREAELDLQNLRSQYQNEKNSDDSLEYDQDNWQSTANQSRIGPYNQQFKPRNMRLFERIVQENKQPSQLLDQFGDMSRYFIPSNPLPFQEEIEIEEEGGNSQQKETAIVEEQQNQLPIPIGGELCQVKTPGLLRFSQRRSDGPGTPRNAGLRISFTEPLQFSANVNRESIEVYAVNAGEQVDINLADLPKQSLSQQVSADFVSVAGTAATEDDNQGSLNDEGNIIGVQSDQQLQKEAEINRIVQTVCGDMDKEQSKDPKGKQEEEEEYKIGLTVEKKSKKKIAKGFMKTKNSTDRIHNVVNESKEKKTKRAAKKAKEDSKKEIEQQIGQYDKKMIAEVRKKLKLLREARKMVKQIELEEKQINELTTANHLKE